MRRLWRFRRVVVVLLAFYAAPFVFTAIAALISGNDPKPVMKSDIFWLASVMYFLTMLPIILTATLSNGEE